jgi:hypothetical protein
MATRATVLIDQVIVRQLQKDFGGRLPDGAAEDALAVAAVELSGSIMREALPQMAFTLARYRLARDGIGESAPTAGGLGGRW